MARAAALLLSALLGAHAAPIMLEPLEGKTGDFRLMLFVPGGLVPPEEYLPMIKAAQAKSALRLAVGLARCHVNLCDAIFEVPGLLEDIVASVNKTRNGALKRSQVFVTGHSLGGVGARHFYNIWPGSAGLALYGTQYNGDHEDYLGPLGYPLDLEAFPGPLLALTGELDLVTFTHAAELYRQWLQAGGEDFKKLPLVIAGMDHSQFCPAFHVKGDLLPEISDEAATETIGEVVGAWLDMVVSGGGAEVLRKYAEETRPIAAPFVGATALDLDWCSRAQRLISQSPKGLTVEATHTFGTGELTRCYPATEGGESGLTAKVCDYRFYANSNSTIPSYFPKYQGAMHIMCKMTSEEKIARQLGLPPVDMKSDEVVNRCRSLNQLAFEEARKLVQKDWPRAVARFEKQGKSVVFKEDSPAYLGPQWLLAGLSWKETEQEVAISSKSLITLVDSKLFPGNHYCTLLAPSRAVELIMAQGLTNRYAKGGPAEGGPAAAILV